MAELFGRYCYIDTPWIAGKRTRYRILRSGVRSNAWYEVPVTGRSELIRHDNMEEIVFVVLDTMVGEDSIIRRFALKDIEVIPADVRPVVRGRWEPHPDPNCKEWDVCTACGTGCKRREYGANPDGTDYVTEWSYPYCPNCGADMSIFMDRTEFLKFLDGQYMIGGDAE